jgi:predicted AAA+ superfamily ATPase
MPAMKNLPERTPPQAENPRPYKMPGLPFAAYCKASGLLPAKALPEFATWGGLPEVLELATPDEKKAFLAQRAEQAYVRDVVESWRMADAHILGNLVDLLAAADGSLTNPHKLATVMIHVLGGDAGQSTIRTYLKRVEDMGLFSRMRRWDVKARRYLDFPVKYYMPDTGLRNARAGFDMEGEDEWGRLVENVVYNELVRRGCGVEMGVVAIPSRATGKLSIKQHDIDFIAIRGGCRAYVQLALGRPSPEELDLRLLPLRKTGDFFRRYLVVEGTARPSMDEDGIVRVGLFPFLLDEGVLGASFF